MNEVLSQPELPSGIRPLLNDESDWLAVMGGTTATIGNCITCRGEGSYEWWASFPTDSGVEDRVATYECRCIDQWVLHRYLSFSGVRLNYQRRGWRDTTGVPAEAEQQVRAYMSHATGYASRGIGLVLRGDAGTGKSLLATLSLRHMLGLGFSGHYVTFSELLDMHSDGWKDKASRDWYRSRVIGVDVLVVDDLGKEMIGRTNFSTSALDEVIRKRVASSKPTIITTNEPHEVIRERYGIYVESLFEEQSVVVEFDGFDYRSSKRQTDIEEVSAGLTRPIVVA